MKAVWMGIGMMAFVGLGVTGCRQAESAPPVPVSIAVAAPSVAPKPTPAADEKELEIAGDLDPIQSADLSFKVGGHLGSIRVSRGDDVKQGQVVATLSDAEAKAQLAQAEAAVAAAEAQAAIAQDQARRVEELAASNAAPGSQVVAAKHQASAAAAGVAVAKAQLALAQANGDNHVLRAPFDGRIVRVADGVGGTVGPGVTVARIEKLDVLVLQATLSEKELDRVKVGDSVVIETATGQEATGRVRSVVRSLESVSRRAPVEIEVPNRDGRLAAGAYVRARVRRPIAEATPRP